MNVSDHKTFRRIDRSVSLVEANLKGTLFGLAPALIVVLVHLWFHRALDVWPRDPSNFVVFLGQLALMLLIIIAGVIAHEGLHALGWMAAGRLPPSAIAFGIDHQTGSPYAHARQPMAINAYRFGAALPAFGLGVVPALIGIGANLPAFTAFGALFLLAAGGDLLILWLIRDDPGHALVIDHPSRAGCEVLVPLADEEQE